MKNKTLLLEYLKTFPNTPSLTLAKKIYAEHPEKFNNDEWEELVGIVLAIIFVSYLISVVI